MLAIEHLVAGDDLAGMSGHAPHGRDQTRFHAALHFAVGLVVANGVGEMFPFQLIEFRLRLIESPNLIGFLVSNVLTFVNARVRRKMAGRRNGGRRPRRSD